MGGGARDWQSQLTFPGSGHCGTQPTPQTRTACRPHPPSRAAHAWRAGRGEERAWLVGQMHPPGWDGSESEIQKDHSLAQGYQTCFFQEHPSFVYFFQTNKKPCTHKADDSGDSEAMWGDGGGGALGHLQPQLSTGGPRFTAGSTPDSKPRSMG